MAKEIYLQDLVTDKGDRFVIGCLHLIVGIVFAIGAIALICLSAIF